MQKNNYITLLFVSFLVLFVNGCSDKNNNNNEGNTNTVDKTNVTWQIQLQGPLNTSYNVELYDIDLFNTDPAIITTLKQRGVKVICYFSAGTYEVWREDARSFPHEAIGNELDEWEGERWLDIRNETVKEIMLSRLDLAKFKGCDGVDPDNVSGYKHDTGFGFTYEDQLTYNKFLSKEAKKRGLSIGLKNDLEQIAELHPYFDFAINEECHQYDECDYLLPFIENNKPVFNIEYDPIYVQNINGARNDLCNRSKTLKFQTLILPWELDDTFRFSCNE